MRKLTSTLAPRPKRNWDQLTDGSTYLFVAGKDFKSINSLRVAASAAARRRNMRSVTEKTETGNLKIQFVSP